MSSLTKLLLIMCLQLLYHSDGRGISKSYFREDYTFVKESAAFYKVHTVRKSWKEAKTQCQKEGATLFYPEDEIEADLVMGLWNKSEPYGWIYLGVSDLLVKGVWETVDSRPLLDVYNNWGAGQPDDTGGSEDCVLWRRDKTLNDYTCHEEYPFICKKSHQELHTNKPCDKQITNVQSTPTPPSFRDDYTFIEETKIFYKVHTTRKAFHDARKQCRTEGAILFYPEDKTEADVVMALWKKSEPYGWIYLGITDLLKKGHWKTIDGRPLLDVYNNWGAGQPDDRGGNEDCVLWRRDKTLSDYTCHEEYPFICKKSLQHLESNKPFAVATTSVQPKPTFRDDYTFIEETKAFYKVHKTRKSFHDARKQCRSEGAILFYPEDKTEAEVVMALWKKGEPYGWIYLGITDLLKKGHWKTIDGRPLLDVYNNWGAGQPDDRGGNEDCVLWRRDKTLSDYTCHEEYPFICKKSQLEPESDKPCEEDNTNVHIKPPAFREDYTLIEETKAFYKVHTIRMAFHDARRQCQTEGATLFYPEDKAEAKVVMALWNRSEPYGWIYLGITDLLVKGHWETVDGRPLLDVYNNWGAGQPDDTGGNEDCVLWRRDKTLNDYTCHEEYPFICKKSQQELESNTPCEEHNTNVQTKPPAFREDYTLIEETKAFYKVHTIRKAFHDARRQCQTEGATLFYPEDKAEAKVVMALWNRSEPYGWIYLGITDLLVKGHWETVDGRPLLDVYNNWGAGQPDDTGGNEDCVLWRRDNTLNDYTCHEEYPFICKKRQKEMYSNKPCDKQITNVQTKPPAFREDYTLIEETKAFYKVHKTRKAFHDARRQCQTEGATLFYPEDKAEAEVVMALWNRSEPYGWIYLGITDLLVKGHWETVDGRPLLDVYNNWGAGQPDDTGGNEDCVLWRRDKTLNDYTCHEEYPFICKRSQKDMYSNKPCDKQITNVQTKPPAFREDYTLIEETKAFYKVHKTRKAFHDARRQCQTEGATLFYPEDKAEAEVVMALWNRSEPYGWIYLGITDLLVKGYWETVDGRPLLNLYNNWGAGQPDDTGGNEDCVLWRRDKTLNDYTCHEEYPFICKKSQQELESDKPCEEHNTNVHTKPPAFREDYTLIEETKAFYKVHTTRKAFHDARRQCQTEGATLFYPEDKAEAEVVMALWNRSEPYGWIYLGITDLLVKGLWETVDGRPLLDVYNNWGAGQPDDTGGNEDCVLWRRDKTLNDYTCHEEYPFICKKSQQELYSNEACDNQITDVHTKPPAFREDYTLIEETKAFYKVHTTRKAFHDARRQCQTEGATLFYPEDKAEAEVVMALWNKSEPYGWIYLGITDLLVKGHWETVDGRPLLNLYNNWGAGQPDDTGGNEDCVLWRRDKTLNDYTCHEEYPFICKKSQQELKSNTPCDKQITNIQTKPPAFREDYTLIEETKAFYKVHTTRKAFHDARRQCQTEGATLFYPEDKAEAEVVMALWNKSEPYGWIYLGITDLLVKGHWETVDGRPLLNLYNNWGAGQPDDTGGNEDCVLWRRDKTLNDYTCHEEYPFICKKSQQELESNTPSDKQITNVKTKPPAFREDYTLIEETKAFYKVHTTRKAFHDARRQCQTEGATLFYPEDKAEAEVVMALWNKSEPYGWIYLGITDLLVKGHWETVDGRLLLNLYNNWGAGQPDDTGGNEDCVLWRRDKTLNDYTCHEEYPFICKKSQQELESNTACDKQITNVQTKPPAFREDYTLIEETKAFYKVHTTRKAFHDARRQCQTEGATLFYPEDKVEAEVVMALWNKSEPYGWIYLGITDLLVKGHWETVDGRPLLNLYNNWGAGQPDDTGGNEDCVLWRRDKTLNDYTCHEEYPFICKKSQQELESNTPCDKQITNVHIKPPAFREDYTLIEETKAFYKVHTTRKAFHDARRQCQTEGATLFYPEDKAEAEVVMALWNKSEPYGWIYLGITDLLVKRHWETVDGRPLLNLYNNWGAGQPDDTGGNEDCVLWRRDKTLNDYTCHEEYPFICKKSQQELESNTPCDKQITNVQTKPPAFREDYTLIEETKAFYKVHTTRKAFHDARRQCQTEGATFFYPEDKAEAEVVMALWNRSEPYGWIYLGITDLLVKGYWETVDGRPLLDVYSNWGAGQPDDTGGNEDCVLWRRDKTLNDYTCHEEYPFICKKSQLFLGDIANSSSNSILDVTEKPKSKFFRKDYTFIQESQAFYKIHTIHRSWQDARSRCQREGSTLFYPENEVEAEVVMEFWNKTQPFKWIYIGVSDLLKKRVWETVDGRLLEDVYNNWGPGQPDNIDNIEDCVTWRRDKTLNDYSCHDKHPYICKKSLRSLHWNTLCDMPDKNYHYNKDLGKCYKFHLAPKNWTDAHAICYSEQSYLAIINSQSEADYLVKVTEEAPKNRIRGNFLSGAVYLGFHNRNDNGWETIKGTTLEESGYTAWGHQQPDGGDRENCGSMFYSGRLNDLECSRRCFFICEHDIGALGSAIDERFGQ